MRLQQKLLLAFLLCWSVAVNPFQVLIYGRIDGRNNVNSCSSIVKKYFLMSSAGDDSNKGIAGFNYNPSDFRDSNSGNYRRLSDRLAAARAEEEQLQKEAEEIKRKEKMAELIRQREGDVFFNTPPETVVATSDKFFVSPDIIQVIADLDKVLIGLQPVKDQMRNLASVYMVNRIRESIGLPVQRPMLNHIFTGNPGTGS